MISIPNRSAALLVRSKQMVLNRLEPHPEPEIVSMKIIHGSIRISSEDNATIFHLTAENEIGKPAARLDCIRASDG